MLLDERLRNLPESFCDLNLPCGFQEKEEKQRETLEPTTNNEFGM